MRLTAQIFLLLLRRAADDHKGRPLGARRAVVVNINGFFAPVTHMTAEERYREYPNDVAYRASKVVKGAHSADF